METVNETKEAKNLRIELVWNREFDWAFWKKANDLPTAIKEAKGIRDSGDGASVKKIRVVDDDNGEILWRG